MEFRVGVGEWWEEFYKVFNAEARNRPLRGFATHREANTPSEASAESSRVAEVFRAACGRG